MDLPPENAGIAAKLGAPVVVADHSDRIAISYLIHFRCEGAPDNGIDAQYGKIVATDHANSSMIARGRVAGVLDPDFEPLRRAADSENSGKNLVPCAQVLKLGISQQIALLASAPN